MSLPDTRDIREANKLTRIEYIKHSSRFFCGTYASNTTSEWNDKLTDNGYTPAYCVRWHYERWEDAVVFFDDLADMMKRMQPKRCKGCFMPVSCRINDGCASCDLAVSKIQAAFRRAIANPEYFLCRRRLLREATEMEEELNELESLRKMPGRAASGNTG